MSLTSHALSILGRTTAEETAAVHGDRQLTFGAWNDQANRLASGLAAAGVRAGDVVAVRMRIRLEWLVASLALAKLGSRLVTLNARLSGPEVAYILADSNAVAVIVDDAEVGPLMEAWAELDLRTVISVGGGHPDADDFGALIAQGDPGERPAADLAAGFTYTSGTTGRPKGVARDVMVDPETRFDYLISVLFDGAAGGPGNRTLLTLPFHHGAGPGALRVALRSGGSVVLDEFDPERALRLIQEHRITHWTAVPTMLQRVLNLPPEVLTRYDVSSLIFLCVGAAPFHPQLKAAALERFGPVVHETYGASEVGMIAGATPEDLRTRSGAVGRPYRHVELRILGPGMDPLPPGELGEIAVRTPEMITRYTATTRLGMAAARPMLRHLGVTGIPMTQVENASASGSSAFRLACLDVASGTSDVVLAVGVDKAGAGRPPVAALQTGLPQLTAMVHPVTHFALLADEYMHTHGVRAEEVAQVAVKNYASAARNPNAQRRKGYDLAKVLEPPFMAGIFTRLQCCPVGDGAAAAILVSEEAVEALGLDISRCVRVLSSVQRSEELYGPKSFDAELTRVTTQEALEAAGMSAADLDLIELHDAFSIEELQYLEAMGVAAEGKAAADLLAGHFDIGGRVAVSTSGGLLGSGHPVGPTGLAQIAEIVTQLRGEAADRQHPDARIGLAHMVGLGAVCVVHVLAGRGV